MLLFIIFLILQKIRLSCQETVDCVKIFEGPNFDDYGWGVVFSTPEGESTTYLKEDILDKGGKQNEASSVVVYQDCQVTLWDLGDPFRGWGFTLPAGSYNLQTIETDYEPSWNDDLSALEVVSLGSAELPSMGTTYGDNERGRDEHMRDEQQRDECPDDPDKLMPGRCGCGVPDIDTDNDGAYDCADECPFDPLKKRVGECGCSVPEARYCDCGVLEIDSDGDGTYDCNDECPDDPTKKMKGRCGCGQLDVDSDSDGKYDCQDECPNDPDKTETGECGCGVPDTRCGCGIPDIDSDGDGSPDCYDTCPNDPEKRTPEKCGCGVPETDSDNDGTPDCNDECPDDPEKSRPQHCGCGIPETDRDEDGSPDCNDECPEDPLKTRAQSCGCGISEVDTDGDGWSDCIDECPEDPDKKAPQQCGCGVPETDTDGDGVSDCIDSCPLSPENGLYCGTLKPCANPTCSAEFQKCTTHFGCYQLMIREDFWEFVGISSPGHCGGLRDARPCWEILHSTEPEVNLEGYDEFESLFNCVYGCSLLGQCLSDDDCQHGGVCGTLDYGASFCQCPDEYLGSDCSIETEFMVEFQSNNYYWLWSVHDGYYYGEYKTKNRGWTAMQFGDDENTQMFNADPIVGSVLEDGTVLLGDLNTPGDGFHDDDSYDLSDISGWFDGVYTHLRFRRQLDTGDPNDYPIQVDEIQRASWAYGDNTINYGMDYHSLYNRGLIHVVFAEGLTNHEWYAQQQETTPVNTPVTDEIELGYECSAVLKAGYVHLFWTLAGSTIKMAFSVNADPDAWTSIAFHGRSVMVGGDAILSMTDKAVEEMGLTFPVNQFNLIAYPNRAEFDPVQDLTSGEREIEDGLIITRFERPLNTLDVNDTVIDIRTPMYVLWAYGSPKSERIDIPDYHELDRGFQVVDFGGCGLARWGPAELKLIDKI